MTYEQIETIVANHFEIQAEDLRRMGKDNSRTVTDAKKYLWYILVGVLGFNRSDVAKEYGVSKRNIYYAVSIIRDGINMQPYYARHYTDILNELKKIDII